MVNLEDVFPEPLRIIGSCETQQELEINSVILMTECKGNFIGFGEPPFDTNDWAARSGTEVIEITVGTSKWKKTSET